MVYTLRFFFSSKCSLFHNSNIFGSCIIHILYTECAKIKKIIPAPKRLICALLEWQHSGAVVTGMARKLSELRKKYLNLENEYI